MLDGGVYIYIVKAQYSNLALWESTQSKIEVVWMVAGSRRGSEKHKVWRQGNGKIPTDCLTGEGKADSRDAFRVKATKF